jgi:hypothetical protein
MKKEVALILILFGIVNNLFSQKKIDLQKYSLDTLSLLTDVFFLGVENRQYKKELLNTFHLDSLNALTVNDSVYIHTLNKTSFKEEFATDGNYLNVFLTDSTISRLPNCAWIELYEIKLKKHYITLKIIRHRKNNFILKESVLYKFKITGGRNNSETLNEYYAPKYKLKSKRPITWVLRQAG